MFDPIMAAMIKPNEIDIEAHGISAMAIITSGQKHTVVEGTEALWEEINRNENFVMKCNAGLAQKVRPSMIGFTDEGVIRAVTFSVHGYMEGVFTSANISLSQNLGSAKTNVYCVVEFTPI